MGKRNGQNHPPRFHMPEDEAITSGDFAVRAITHTTEADLDRLQEAVEEHERSRRRRRRKRS